MKLSRSTVLLVSLIAFLGAGMLVAAPPIADESPAESPQLAEQQEADLQEPAPSCGTQESLLFLDGQVVDAEPKPVGVCNCNLATSDRDCRRVCGDRGGSCQITTDCIDPDWEGVCFCNY